MGVLFGVGLAYFLKAKVKQFLINTVTNVTENLHFSDLIHY